MREYNAKYRKKYPDRPKKQRDAFLARRREFLIAYKSSHPCVQCGESNWKCLDFHHIDPDSKTDNVSTLVWGRTMDMVLAEIEKCVVLCSNCHRKLTVKDP